MVLSTCNRTEVYAVVTNVAAGFKELESFFQSARQIADHQELQANFKLLRSDATLHLMRVACGLDSMVLGEGQIMAQVKAAHQAALRAGTAGAILDGLFKAALNCGKKVRSQTSLGRRAVSISSAAVELTRKLLGDLHNRKICIIGAGRMGQICVKLLLTDQNNCSVYVVNRSASKTKALLASNVRHLDRLHVVEDFAQRHSVAASCDAVIVAASASEFLLTAEGFDSLGQFVSANTGGYNPPLQKTDIHGDDAHGDGNLRANTCESDIRPYDYQSTGLHIIDMSVPRNVDPKVSDLTGIELHNFDDLAAIVKQNMAEREALTHAAEIIIFAALRQFERWQQTLLAAPVIAQLRGKVETIRQSHLLRHPSSKRHTKHNCQQTC